MRHQVEIILKHCVVDGFARVHQKEIEFLNIFYGS